MNGALVLAFALGATAPAPQLAPASVLAKYNDALVSVVEPKSVIFNYTIVQLGQPPIYQMHRIYRSGAQTRDETVEVDGHALSSPTVRIATGRTSAYRIAAIAPTPANYTFTFVKSIQNGRDRSYVFATDPIAESPFTVNEVTIDGATFLPSHIAFTTVAGSVTAKGTLTYAKIERYWLVVKVDVEAGITGERAAERILWRNYAFPATLPPGTFKG